MMVHKAAFWASSGVLVVSASAFPVTQTPKNQPKPGVNRRETAKPINTGEQIFRQQCASCHGAKGQGGDGYARALTGDRSAGQLARYIAQAMPPGPKHCSTPEAEKVASYIYDAFYSPLAQERNRPARVALSRLTVRQLRNSVSDLVGSFRNTPTIDQAQGLRAEYFKARDFRKEDRLVERTDPQVRFNWGQQPPSGDAFNPYQFSARWSGSIVAPDTGEYEIIVRTEHSTRLWLNNQEKPLLDAWVKSGKDTEFRSSLYLIGGQAYPIRLEFSKSTQGVDDSDKNKTKPVPSASMALLWKRPKQVEEVIPARCLRPMSVPQSIVVSVPFPPDDRSMGYERGDSVSKSWDEATTSAALDTADYVVSHLQELAGTTDDPTKLRVFCRKFVERAFRRPLDPESETRYVARQFDKSPDMETAVKRVVLLTLKSPRFLYRELGASTTDPYDTASRLSFALWDSLPDDTLLKAAASGTLNTREQITAQAERMVLDNRAWYKQREFFLQWLKVDQYPDLSKDAKKFPDFTPSAAADLRTSLDLTLESIVRSEHSDFRELMLSPKVYLNGRLAPLYGVSLESNAPFQPVVLDAKDRAGILTHPYVLSSFAYHATSSPIHRGVLLSRNIMGRTLKPPPNAFAPLAADLVPQLTTRQRVSLQTKPVGCMSCHGIINPLGFTLERFDAIGRLRTTENGKPIDATGSYVPRTGPPVQFGGARDLARYVANSDEAQAAFVEKLFQFTVKQPIRAYGTQALPGLEQAFKDKGYNIRELVVQIATEAALPRTKPLPQKVARPVAQAAQPNVTGQTPVSNDRKKIR